MTGVLFSSVFDKWTTYEEPLRAAFAEAGLDVRLSVTLPPEDVHYIVYAPDSPIVDFSIFPNLKAVLNLWAGVETVVGNDTLTKPLARMVEPGLTEGMVEWVTGHVLRHHLGMDRHIVNPDRAWAPVYPPLARDRTVAILGMGALGPACGKALATLNFPVLGWSRSPKTFPGIETHAGSDGLTHVLSRAEILVLLLPATPATERLIDANALGLLPEGAVILNPGRGSLVDDDALLAALDRGHIAHAALDVFRTEPLPSGHPYWAHPGVTVTPHIASETRAASASRTIAENVRRGEAGEPLLYLVDRNAGY